MEEKLKLLVVDDESDNLDLLYRTFRREFEVFKAESGAEALEILAVQGEMAIIISDQRMPKMSGTDFLSRTVERFPNTIRMVLTGYTDVEDLVSAINSGKVFKYITKPWDSRQLKVVVKQAAETYTVIKQRTQALSQALEQESLRNSIMTAVRGSLDYISTLQTVVSVLGKAFHADLAILYPVGFLPSETNPQALLVYRPKPLVVTAETVTAETVTAETVTAETFCTDLAALSDLPKSLEIISQSVLVEGQSAIRIVVPFIDQEQSIATLCLYKKTRQKKWASSAIVLLQNVSSQVALAISHAKLYQQTHQQSMQMRAELEVARRIQSNLLHQSWPEIAGIKIQARCQPAREVGGDFFEVFVHPQGDIWLAVGDVSGKGVPAALFMASAISILRRELAQEISPDPDRVMHNLNHSLLNDLVSNNCFITMVLIRYSPKTGKLLYANAGHVYPIVWSHRDMVVNQRSVAPTYLDVRGVPLGILPVWAASAGRLQLSVGDVLLLTSDGITEATVPNYQSNQSNSSNGSPSRSMLNQEGLWEFLKQQPADLNLDHLLAFIYLPEGEQEDDQTILSLEVTSC